MSAEVVVDVRLGVIIISCPQTGEKRIIDRDETGRVVVSLDEIRPAGNHPDAEKPDAPWQPLQRATSFNPTDDLQRAIKEHTAEEDEQTFMNDTYTVIRSKWKWPGGDGPDLIHLSIRRNDRLPAVDWRHFQKIKNDLVGEEHEAVELFPAESRMVDTSNQYHLWVLAEKGLHWPVGYEDGRVTSSRIAMGNARQRPFVDGETETHSPEKLEELREEFLAKNPNYPAGYDPTATAS